MDKKEKASLAVFGLGYVGLPLSLLYASKGCKVYGVDISEKLINQLERGVTHHLENYNGKPIDKILQECLQALNFIPSTDASTALQNCDKFIVTVGIPFHDGILDFIPLQSVCRTISSGLKPGDTVVIRSTVVPGTTEEMLLPLLENSGLKAGQDFNLAYCPERISEGNAFDEFENVQVIMSGINQKSIDAGTSIINMISGIEPLKVKNIKIAETSKVLENVQRDVNIAMVQQFTDFCRKLGISVFEEIAAVNTHPRVNLLKPGPGVGGYCIPNALHYLEPKAEELESDITLLQLSREINSRLPSIIVSDIEKCLIKAGKKPDEAKVAVLGLAMKDYCSDDRLSPVLEIIEGLISKGTKVRAYDPCIAASYPYKTDKLEECLENADCLLITAMQKGLDYNDLEKFKSLMKENPIIFDTRNIIDKDHATHMGFITAGF